MTRHLVIGASGLVGAHLLRGGAEAGLEVLGTHHRYATPATRELDILSAAAVQALLKDFQPAVVYLPASLPNVDYCEEHPAESYAVNVGAVGTVVRGVNAVKARLVYFSSDYVFNGTDGPYGEEDPADPICEYGRQKVLAEHLVALQARDFQVVRTTVVYGREARGKNFLYRLASTIGRGAALKVPDDQIGNPTYAPNLAAVVVALACSGPQGVFHVVGTDRVERYTFAREAARVFGWDDGLLMPVATRELGQKARRPLCAGMRTDKVRAHMAIPLIGYREGLRLMAGHGRFV